MPRDPWDNVRLIVGGSQREVRDEPTPPSRAMTTPDPPASRTLAGICLAAVALVTGAGGHQIELEQTVDDPIMLHSSTNSHDQERLLQSGITIGHVVDIDFDPQGNLVWADSNTWRVWKRDATTGVATLLAGVGSHGSSGDGGPAVSAKFNSIRGIGVDSQGSVYIGDTSVNRVRMVDATSGIISNYAGSGSFGFSGDGGLATLANFD